MAVDRRRRRPANRGRRYAAAVGAGLLVVVLGGCSGLGRTAVGPVFYDTEKKDHVQVNSPPVKGCHRFGAQGAVSVHNNTLVDLLAYPTDDCSGDGSIYVVTMTSDVVAPGAGPWKSYSFVH
ncbi:hypothetical protein [Streptomyces sp. NPDC058953]|uniref:hypothetical protein n=1 Tax=unclassified Streptomyces TaxID=2593676 RepID=UPI003683284F